MDLLESPTLPVDDHLAIERALAALSPTDREVVMLRHFDGLSYAELAGSLGIPIGTVMSRLFNATRCGQVRRLLAGVKEGLRRAGGAGLLGVVAVLPYVRATSGDIRAGTIDNLIE